MGDKIVGAAILKAGMKKIQFGSRGIGSDEPVLIIAEIGINHEGNFERCLQMVEAAVRAGADAIKLQTSDPDENYPPNHPSHQIYASSRLTADETAKIFSYARQLDADAFTTTGISDLDWVERLAPAAYKISSGLVTHLPLIRRIAALGRPMLISTGMSDVNEVDEAISTARIGGCNELAVMQCTSLYPTPVEMVSLRSIAWLASRYDTLAGFSDHTQGAHIAAMAVSAGACVIEKHFSFDPRRAGFDHGVSLNESGFREMVGWIRQAEAARGKPEKHLMDGQFSMAQRMRRTLVARRDIPKGAIIATDDVAIMRSPDGISAFLPRDLERVLGRKAKRAVPCWTSLPADIIDEASESFGSNIGR